MKKILTRKNLTEWMRSLKGYHLIAPVPDGNHWSFVEMSNPETLAEMGRLAFFDSEFTNSVVPVKRFVFPQKETLFEFEETRRDGACDSHVKLFETLPAGKPALILGMRPCDGKALTHYDKIFGGEFEDPYYRTRRDSITTVGLTCNKPPSRNCFCPSVDGSPHSSDGLDVLMTDLEDRFFLESFTGKGDELLKSGAALLIAPGKADEAKKATIDKKSEENVVKVIENMGKLRSKLEKSFDSNVWNELAEKCIQCGICTYLCPTCHCFDMNDQVCCTSPLKGKRVRSWDTCQFPDFTMHSSGHNPRSGKASQLRQRILHKFQYFPELHGKYLCTGCGRCIDRCPVGIDIVEVLETVRDYEEK